MIVANLLDNALFCLNQIAILQTDPLKITLTDNPVLTSISFN